jgi:peptidoglycan/LPS O-acetylase OafA/YrhL
LSLVLLLASLASGLVSVRLPAWLALVLLVLVLSLLAPVLVSLRTFHSADQFIARLFAWAFGDGVAPYGGSAVHRITRCGKPHALEVHF